MALKKKIRKVLRIKETAITNEVGIQTIQRRQISPITNSFGRADLDELRDKLNEVIETVNNRVD